MPKAKAGRCVSLESMKRRSVVGAANGPNAGAGNTPARELAAAERNGGISPSAAGREPRLPSAADRRKTTDSGCQSFFDHIMTLLYISYNDIMIL